jgi:biopolymer transport protein ExbD/biopolymer transport protein TolR
MSFGRLQRRPPARPMSDINMTPLIDVMLVLLVIFIISAPLMVSSLPLELPASDAAQPRETPAAIAVAIDPQGRFYLGEEALEPPAFAQRIAELARQNPAAEVQLRADRGVPYGRVAELIGLVQQAGLSRIGLVAESAGEPAAR